MLRQPSVATSRIAIINNVIGTTLARGNADEGPNCLLVVVLQYAQILIARLSAKRYCLKFIVLREKKGMSVARVTEITVSSSNSFDDAIKEGISRATKTLENVTGAWIQDQEIRVSNGSISEYRVHMKVTFILND